MEASPLCGCPYPVDRGSQPPLVLSKSLPLPRQGRAGQGPVAAAL